MRKKRVCGWVFGAMLAYGSSSTFAQITEKNDPANLAGERVSPQDPADTLPLNHGAPALQQLLAKLRTRASLMLIVAHPDDEDGGLLTYESRGQGARVAMLTLTRGEGGQNLMSADFDDALGLIRTQELLAADRYFGVDQLFGTEVDFGFSKTKEEAFQKWTHERVLYDAVRAVRLYRPLVIASVFVGGPTDGHGQHQVSGEITQEAFVAAADPKVFPEMIAEGLLPWAPLKVYARVPFSRVSADGMYDYATGRIVPTRFHNYVTGADTTAVPAATVLIHEGDKPTDPTLAGAMGGDSYVQFARKGLALQKTQIGPSARLAPAGAFDAPYTLMASRAPCTQAECPILPVPERPRQDQSVFDEIDISLQSVASLAPTAMPNVHAVLKVNLNYIDSQIAEAQRLFTPDHVELTAPSLRDALRVLDTLIVNIGALTPNLLDAGQRFNLLHELRVKRVQLNNALTLALGLALHPELAATSPYVTANQTIQIAPHFSGWLARLPSPEIRLVTAPGLLSPTGVLLDPSAATISRKPPPTQPYFHRSSSEQPFYNIDGPALRNAPQTPSPFKLHLTVDYEGVPLDLESTVTAATSSPARSPDLPPAPAVIVPGLSISLSPTSGILTPITRPLVMTAVVSSEVTVPKATATVIGPAGWEGTLDAHLENRRPGQRETIPVAILPKNYTPGQTYKIDAAASDATQTYRQSFRSVGYPGLPYTNFYTPAVYRATAVDVTTAPGVRIAYVSGTGDAVPDFLPNLGIIPTIFTLKDLTPTNLKQYDAILLGVRAYAAHPELAGPGSQPLLDYAKQGGVVILQYNNSVYGGDSAPFPIDVPGDPAHNVVEEAQPVTLLHPESPLLSFPNRITAGDFDGWVSERGHGFAASWSPGYTPLLETHDAGQDPQRGGLLLARTGKGAYIYCAFALYRQLPEGVPGAYRLLANLLSYAKAPNR